MKNTKLLPVLLIRVDHFESFVVLITLYYTTIFYVELVTDMGLVS